MIFPQYLQTVPSNFRARPSIPSIRTIQHSTLCGSHSPGHIWALFIWVHGAVISKIKRGTKEKHHSRRHRDQASQGWKPNLFLPLIPPAETDSFLPSLVLFWAFHISLFNLFIKAWLRKRETKLAQSIRVLFRSSEAVQTGSRSNRPANYNPHLTESGINPLHPLLFT